MGYGKLRRHQYFIAKYQFIYPSGKKWVEEKEYLAYSEIGVKDIIFWIYKGRKIEILSIVPTYRYAGEKGYPDNFCVGDR